MEVSDNYTSRHDGKRGCSLQEWWRPHSEMSKGETPCYDPKDEAENDQG
jgi:hypothetical protein